MVPQLLLLSHEKASPPLNTQLERKANRLQIFLCLPLSSFMHLTFSSEASRVLILSPSFFLTWQSVPLNKLSQLRLDLCVDVYFFIYFLRVYTIIMPAPSSSSSVCTFLFIFLLAVRASNCAAKATKNTRPPRQLSVDYYAKKCPQLEQIVGSVTSQQFKEAPVSGPATIRLFFHDCFVEGCDASILISTNPGSKELAEKDAEDNKDLRAEAFQTINKAKELVERKCPGIVSCADILAVAARDFVHLAGGPYYQVKKGRWDGKISMASRVQYNIPRANFTMDQLLKLFNSKGLTLEDLVVLSGAHTFGFAHCKQFVGRLYNYSGTKQPDPDMDPRLLKALQMSCPQFGGNSDIIAPFDVTTPFMFDHAYYGNLEAKLGLLASDQALVLDPRTKPLVQQLGKDKQKFFQAFSVAMEKMGSIGVKRGRRHGEKRRYCSVHT